MKKFKELGRGWKIGIICVAIVALLVSGTFAYNSIPAFKKQTTTAVTTQKATLGDIAVSIKGTGVVSPIERYDIVPLVKGTILECKFNEGDKVNKGDVLYRFDANDVNLNIEKTKNSITRTYETVNTNNDNITHLIVRAPVSGVISGINNKVGEQINVGRIAIIVNNDNMVVKISYNSSQIDQIHLNDSATITSAQFMSNVSGKVTYISDVSQSGGGGSVLYGVEITITNPGAFTGGASVGATVHTSSGDVTAPVSGTMNSPDETSVLCEGQGKIVSINVKNNERVNAGDVLMRLENDSLSTNAQKTSLDIKDLNLTLASQQKQLEDYNITSPIAGTVITKNSKAGDNISGSTGSSNILMTVADMSKMKFTLKIDELDMAKVVLGQNVKVTADALTGKEFAGIITKIASEGTSTNGVSTYDVEVTINDPQDLKSGMNVNAEVILESKQNVVIVPAEAVSNIKDGYGMVTVKRSVNTSGSKTPDPQGTSRPSANGGQNRPTVANSKAKAAMKALIPEGFTVVRAQVGITTDSEVEIISGISEGEEVLMPTISTTTTNKTTTGFGGQGGGFSGGGMPSGGSYSGGNRSSGSSARTGVN